MNYEKIGQFIAKKRKEKNLTQAELANLIGVTNKAVSKWERGLGCPDVSLLEVLSNILDVSILEILKGRIIENEIIPVTEANDYILETVKYSNNQILNKYKNIFLNVLSLIIICICSFLAILNIYHIIYLNQSEEYDFSSSDIIKQIKTNISEIEDNINKIKNNQNILEENDYKKIILLLDENIFQYQNMNILTYKGIKTFNINDLYLLDLELPSSLNIIEGYNILLKYDSSVENYIRLFKSSFIAKAFVANNFYTEPDISYQYKLLINSDNIYYLPQISKVTSRLYNIQYYTEELLYFTKMIIKVGEINE